MSIISKTTTCWVKKKLNPSNKKTWEKIYFCWTRGGGGWFPQRWIIYGDEMNIKIHHIWQRYILIRGEVRSLSTKCEKFLVFLNLPLQVHNWLVLQKLIFGGKWVLTHNIFVFYVCFVFVCLFSLSNKTYNSFNKMDLFIYK